MSTTNAPATRRQDIVASNVSLMITARGLLKRDLAKAMGISPQAMASRLQSKANWTLDEACDAADFLHVPLSTLMRPDLTAAEILGYEKTGARRAANVARVGAQGLEPWTSEL